MYCIVKFVGAIQHTMISQVTIVLEVLTSDLEQRHSLSRLNMLPLGIFLKAVLSKR